MSMVRGVVFVGATLLAIGTHPVLANERLPWQRSPWFDEQSFTATLDSNVRVHVNAPLDKNGRPARASRLIVYTLPAGNTIEQTLGCKMKDGLDWHFDIQHVAAQVRLLRTLDPKESIVLVCVEGPGLSWSSFRKAHPDADARMARLVEDWRKEFGRRNARVTLTGHSNGGSFMFGVIDGADKIPAYVDRIAFLDANYNFDAAKHADKIARWLKGNNDRRLIVVAYDDREIMLDGKKVLGPTGGTYRATARMRNALEQTFPLTESTKPPFEETTGLDGRIHFFVHPNPENKILHTVLVGEMNGLAHVATLGTPNEETWGKFGGPRAYSKWVQAEPTQKSESGSAPAKSTSKLESATNALKFPPRPADAVGGHEFMKQLATLNLDDREAAIFHEITRGNVPDYLRTLKPVPIHGTIQRDGKEHAVDAAMEAMPDYLAVGSDDDFVRIPMLPQTAQRIADALECTLPTRKMVDAIDAAAEVRLAPQPLTKDRESIATFVEHHELIEKQRGGKQLGQLITGIKKDIVLSPRIFEKPQRLAIYGWRQPGGKPIQPLTIVHWNRYVDYSHGVRLIRDAILLEVTEVKISELLADPDRCGIVSDEGPMDPPRYPLE